MLTFAKWYVGKLKSAPMTSNVVSALVLMIVGDVAAQEIEIHYAKEEEKEESSGHKLSFRRYGTLSPDLRAVQQQATLKAIEDNHAMLPLWQEEFRSVVRSIDEEISSLDFFRMGTMSFWAACCSTPFFLALYRLYDRILPPVTTPFTVAARVAMSLAMSVPVNATFFVYGTFVHHTTEWIGLIEEWRYEIKEATTRQVLRQVPFDFDMFWSTARLKIETELGRTVMASAMMWVPINAINFAFAPPHLRPLFLSVFSAFWNCYLSLAQHREAKIS